VSTGSPVAQKVFNIKELSTYRNPVDYFHDKVLKMLESVLHRGEDH
jgi:hypothetical protein